jgi:large subunit ribosomal protein L6
MAASIVESSIEIPRDVTLKLEGSRVTVSGEKGQLIRDFGHAKIDMEHGEGSLRIWVMNPRKREASIVNTIATNIKNMIKGVTKGYTYRMKIVFVHFPMTVRVEGRRVAIQNFVGEKKPRLADIVGDARIRIEGEDVIIEGIDIEDVAQTAANIQQATKIRRKDLRKFLDGIYVYNKE